MSNLQFLRLARGFTQKALAAQVGVTQQAIAKWERGGEISSDNADRLARALGVRKERIFPELQSALSDSERIAVAEEVAEEVFGYEIFLTFKDRRASFVYSIGRKTYEGIINQFGPRNEHLGDWICFETVDRMMVAFNRDRLALVQMGADLSPDLNPERLEKPQRVVDDADADNAARDIDDSGTNDSTAREDDEWTEPRCFRLFVHGQRNPIEDLALYLMSPLDSRENDSGLVDLMYVLQAGYTYPREFVSFILWDEDEGPRHVYVDPAEIELLEGPSSLFDLFCERERERSAAHESKTPKKPNKKSKRRAPNSSTAALRRKQ